MKRILMLFVAAALLAGTAFADRDDGPGWGPGRGYGPGGRGPGMMGGGPGWGAGGDWGPGMMGPGGMGPGMMGGGWWDSEAFAQLPADKRAKLRDLAVETERKMLGQRAALHELMLTLRQSSNQFPLDKGAALKAWEGANLLHKQMFEARLDATAKAQEILGKDAWEKMHEGWGPERGGPPGRR
jgi:hypothetical protein